MKFLGLNGRTYGVQLKSKPRKNASVLHVRIRNLLKTLFPFDPVVEEFRVPGSKLYLDFFLPQQTMAVEGQGEQHYKYNAHFYDNKLDYYRALTRDKDKQRWCELNNIILITLPFNEDEIQWRSRLLTRD